MARLIRLSCCGGMILRDHVPAQLMFVTYICQARSNSVTFWFLLSTHSSPRISLRVFAPTGDINDFMAMLLQVERLLLPEPLPVPTMSSARQSVKDGKISFAPINLGIPSPRPATSFRAAQLFQRRIR